MRRRRLTLKGESHQTGCCPTVGQVRVGPETTQEVRVEGLEEVSFWGKAELLEAHRGSHLCQGPLPPLPHMPLPTPLPHLSPTPPPYFPSLPHPLPHTHHNLGIVGRKYLPRVFSTPVSPLIPSPLIPSPIPRLSFWIKFKSTSTRISHHIPRWNWEWKSLGLLLGFWKLLGLLTIPGLVIGWVASFFP